MNKNRMRHANNVHTSTLNQFPFTSATVRASQPLQVKVHDKDFGVDKFGHCVDTTQRSPNVKNISRHGSHWQNPRESLASTSPSSNYAMSMQVKHDKANDYRVSYWAGMRVEGKLQAFEKTRDATKEWQHSYYNGGLFEKIGNRGFQ